MLFFFFFGATGVATTLSLVAETANQTLTETAESADQTLTLTAEAAQQLILTSES